MTWQWCLFKNGFKLPCPFCILFPIHDLLCPAAQGYRQVLEIRNATNPALYHGGSKLDVRRVSYLLDVDRVANKYLGWYGSSGVISWDRKINSLIFIASHALLKFVQCLVSCFVTKLLWESNKIKQTVLSISNKGWQVSGALAVEVIASTTQRSSVSICCE